jgi:hypothetical protein
MGEPGELLYDVEYPDHLSRLLIFVKWLMIIPHLIVLAILGIGVWIVTFIAWFAILITGRYPRGMWDFVMMVMRWSARMNAYGYLMRDEYPPFGDQPYPIRFAMIYPERLSRWKIFLKWLLIIPHIVVIYFINLAMGLVGFIAWWVILFTGRYPRGLFDFYVGGQRWMYRIIVYILLLTDAYPPFSTEQVATPPPPTAYAPAASY